jgi:hypothetical protein
VFRELSGRGGAQYKGQKRIFDVLDVSCQHFYS